jgi:serine/alanine adding enzyme
MDESLMQDLKKQLKILKQNKGEASRQIGQAKKTGGDTATLIKQVQISSQQINEIESKLKEPKKEVIKSQQNEAVKVLPAQFKLTKAANTKDSKIEIDIHCQGSDWDGYVNKHPNATIYHRWSIKTVIEKTFGHRTHYLSAVDEGKNIQGILPLVELNSRLFGHFLVSMPFFNYGGILFSNSQALQKLLTHASQLAKTLGAEHIEFRDCHPLMDLPVKSTKVAMLLTLPATTDALWQNLGTKLRAQIKKAERSGLGTKVGRQELLHDFYAVFSTNMRDLGTPVYSLTLFEHMLLQHESSKLIVVYQQTKPVSAGFVLGWRNTLEIPWASTLRSANKYDANMKLYWEVLQYAIQNRYEVFDFGRSSKDANTYKFKKQWGAAPAELYWHYWLPDNEPLPEINPNNPKFKLLIWCWKKLPVCIANLLGPRLVKYLP